MSGKGVGSGRAPICLVPIRSPSGRSAQRSDGAEAVVQAFQRVFKLTVGNAGITEPATPHTSHHAFAAHLLQSGYDIRTVQAMRRNSDVATTMIYTHVLRLGAGAVRSPLVRSGCRSTSGIPATAPGCARPAGPGSHERLLRRP